MLRNELIDEAKKDIDPITKNLYKNIASEMDRLMEDNEKTFIKVVKRMIRDIRGNKLDNNTRYELSVLYKLIPNPIDLEEEYNFYINNALSINTKEHILKYFRDEYDCRYNHKKLNNLLENDSRLITEKLENESL